MRPVLLALVLLLATAAAAGATQVSYIDQGQVWVSTLDGAQKRAISGPAPVIEAGESRAWTEQAQSDDGWIVGVARVSGHTGAAAPTRLWSPSGAVAAQGTLGYHGAYNNGGLAVPIQLDLTPGGQQMTYTYSDIVYGYPTSTVYKGTWVQNTSSSGGEPFDIPGLVGSSLVGSRWVGVDGNAGSSDPNIAVEAPGGQGPFSTTYDRWFHATGASSVDVAANGSAVAVVYQLTSGGPYALALFGATGLGAPLTGASCDVPTVGNVNAVSLSQDGAWLAWTDDRGLVVAPTPPLGSGSPCPLASAPVVISATGSHPSLGATTLATAPATPAAPPGTTTPPPGPTATTPPTTAAPTTTAPTRSSRPVVSVARSVRASAFAKGVRLVVTVARKGTVTVTAKVGRTTLARGSAKARKAGRVALTLKSSKKVARRLGRYKGKTLKILVTAPGGRASLTRRLR
jgi:hypothetical protein